MHLVAKSYIHEACAEFREEGENESESMRLFEVRLRDGHAGDNHGAVNRVLQWGSLARDRVLLALYESQRTVRYLSCESSWAATSQSGSERKAEDSSGLELREKLSMINTPSLG